jgi:hypothetical protein
MSRCKIFGYAFSLVPLKKWQGFLIRSHMEKCPKCQKTLINREAVQRITIQESQCGGADSLWNGFEEKVREEKTNKQHVFRPRWSWAYGIAVVLALVAATVWLVLSPQFRSIQVEESLNGHFRINYMRIENQPAQTYLFQPQDSHMIIVWAQKNISGE